MKKAKYIVFVLALLSCICFCFASCTNQNNPDNPDNPGNPDTPDVQTERTISGEVVSDLGALSGAQVSVRSTDYKAVTATDGKFEIKLSKDDSSADTYTLVVTKDGFIDCNVTVKADDFKNDAASVKATLLSQKITITGTVKDKNAPVADAVVGVSCDSETAKTGADGRYTLVIDRPGDAFKVTVKKDFYNTAEVSVTDFAVTEYLLDATLEKQSANVSGSVNHYYYGDLAGVSVTVKGTGYSAVTDEKGKFAIENIEDVALPCTLVLSKAGYQTKEIALNESGTVDVELVSEEIALGQLSPSNKNYSMYVVRDSAGIHFRFVSSQQIADTDKLCVYIDVNETGTTSVGSTVAELGLCGNGICLLWNLKKNVSATEGATIFWDDEVKFNINKENGTEITAFISYDTFAKLGDEFAITKDSVVGLSFFDRGAGVSGAAGWDRADMPGADGAAWVHPDNPKDFVRLAPENVIYEADSNNRIASGDRTVVFTVREGQVRLSGASVRMVVPYDKTAVSDSMGSAQFVLSGEELNKTPVFEVTLGGYVSKAVILDRDSITGDLIAIDVDMKVLPTYLEDTGRVENYNGAFEGVTVQVKGHEDKGFVTTNAQGEYDLSSLQIELNGAATYEVVLSKAGYQTKEVTVAVGADTAPIYMKANARNLGKFGEYGWDITIDRDDVKLIIDAKSDLNWYGYSDKNGAPSGENNFQIWFAKNLQAKVKTADEIRELRIVEKQSTGAADWAGWLDGNFAFLAWPGINFTVTNGEDGCTVHAEILYSVLNIDKTTTIGLGFGEWYAANTLAPWACPFYDGATQKFVESGWGVNCNDPSTLLHWAPDNSTQVVFVAG